MRIVSAPGTVLLVALVLSPAPCAAQPDETAGEGPRVQELREAMQSYFQNRLRAELALSDDQMAEIVPLVEQIEQSRMETVRGRRETVRALQRGLREGATDAELLEQLERLDRIEIEQRELEARARGEIEQELSARQRVQFRFFIDRFRREVQRKVQGLREERGQRAPGPRRRRPDRP